MMRIENGLLAVVVALCVANAAGQTTQGSPGSDGGHGTGAGTTNAQSQYPMPLLPAAPTQPSQCQMLRKEWSDVNSKVERDHQACLDANRNQKPRPNSAPEVGRCSQAACAALHDILFDKERQKYQDAAQKWCDESVRAYQDATARLHDPQPSQPNGGTPPVSTGNLPRADDAAARAKQDARDRIERELRDIDRRERDQRQIASEGIEMQNRIEAEAKSDVMKMALSAASQVLGGSVEAAVNATGQKELATVYSVAKDLTTALDSRTSTEDSALASASAVGSRFGDSALSGAADATAAVKQATEGDYVGAASSALGAAGSIVEATNVTDDALKKIRANGLAAAGGVMDAYQGATKVLESASQWSGVENQAAFQNEQIQRRWESFQQKITYERNDAMRRLDNLRQPVVTTFQNYGTTWGVRSDGSVIDFGTGTVYSIDRTTGLIVRR